MNTREAFEATISAPPFEADVSRHPDSGAEWPGCYKDYQVHLAWDLFQAGAAWAARECAEWAFNTYRQYRPKEDEFGEGKSEGAKEVAHIIAREFPEAFR